MTLNNLRILFSEKGQKAEAKENFEKALEILKKLSKKTLGMKSSRKKSASRGKGSKRFLKFYSSQLELANFHENAKFKLF